MANEPVITTKFTPGNPDPIFFAGQQEKIFKYYKILQNYLSQYPNIYGENIYILQGDTGLGKTTFLKHLQKYVQNNIAKLIPMYISCNDLLGTPERFLKIFWIEFENLVQSSEFQLNTINTFLQQTNWKEILLKISPRLSSFSFINTPLPFQSLCDILKKAYLDIENFSEMLQIMQWILQESGLFLFLMLDDFLIIQQNSKVEQTILSSLYQIQKANSVFFFLLTIDIDTWEDIEKNIDEEPSSILYSLVKNINFLSIDNKDQVMPDAIPFIQSLPYFGKLSMINIAPTLMVEMISRAIKGQCASQYHLFRFHQERLKDWKSYFATIARSLILQVQDIFKKNPNIKELVRQLESQEITVLQSLDVIVQLFCKLLVKIDDYLEKNNGKYSVIFLEEIEHFISDDDTSPLKSSRKCRKIIPSFLKIFKTLQKYSLHLRHISIVFLTHLPEKELSIQRNLSIENFVKICPNDTLYSLSQEEGVQILQEIGLQSGIEVPNNIAQEIYKRSEGNLFYLHYVANYLIQCMEKNIPEEHKSFYRDNILTQKKNIAHSNYPLFQVSTDGKLRIIITNELFRKFIPNTVEDLYQNYYSQVTNDVSRRVLNVLLDHPAGLTKNELYTQYQQSEQAIEKTIIESSLVQLKDDWIMANGVIKILHPCLTKYLQNLQKQFEKRVSQHSKIYNTSIRGRMQLGFFPTRRLRPPYINTKTKEEDGDQFIQEAILWLEKGFFPTFNMLTYLSNRMTLDENNVMFKSSTHYIFQLCTYIHDKLNLDIDVARIFSLFKIYLSQSMQQYGTLDLYFACKKLFTSSDGLSVYIQNDLSLAKMNFLLYSLSGSTQDLIRSIDFCYDCFSYFPIPEGLSELLMEIEQKIVSQNTESSLQEWVIILHWTRKIVTIQSDMLGLRTFKQDLETWTPIKLPPEFHSYFLKYLGKVIQGQTPLALSAIKIVGFYGHIFHQNMELLSYIIDCIETNLELSKAAIDTLVRLLPYFKEDDKQQILTGLQELFLQNTDFSLRRHILEKIDECLLMFAPSELVSFFFNCIEREENPHMQRALWKSLGMLKGVCSPDEQREILDFLLNYYEIILMQEMEIDELTNYTNILLTRLPKNLESLDNIANRFVEILEKCNNNIWNNNIRILSILYSYFSLKKQQEINKILVKWIFEKNYQKQKFAFSHLYLFYADCNNKEELHNLIVDPVNREYLCASTKSLQILSFQLPIPIRQRIWNEAIAYLENFLPFETNKYNCPLLFIPILRTLLDLCCHYSQEENDRLANIIVTLLRREKTEWI